MNEPTIHSVQVGRVAPLGPRGILSGFIKTAVTGRISVGPGGLVGDEQGALGVHGDAAKAVYAYAASSYEIWRVSHPRHASLWHPGGVAENLTIEGADEEKVCIGDIVRIGSARLQVTQPREPCATLALRFDDPALPKAMIANGRSGWYYRVLAAGEVGAGDSITLLDRPNPEWTILRMYRFIFAKPKLAATISELMDLPGIAESWIARLKKAERALRPAS